MQDLTALLDHLGIEKAAAAGQSMGGWTGCGFASAHPERTSALLSCDTTGGVETPEVTKAQAGIQERSRGSLAQILTNAYSSKFPERHPALCFLYQQISALKTRVTPNSAPLLFGLKYDLKLIIAHKIPTLLLVGEEDVLTRRKQWPAWQRRSRRHVSYEYRRLDTRCILTGGGVQPHRQRIFT